MNPDLVAALIRDYPKLFELATVKGERMAAYGTCECGDGWEPILRRLCEKVKQHEELRFDCIKEKFGGLRVYCAGAAPDSAWDAFEEAEREALATCEVCGQPGKSRSGAWIRTLCDEHHKPKGP